MREDIGGISMDLANHPLKAENELIKEVYIKENLYGNIIMVV